jgi:hypothetical protein
MTKWLSFVLLVVMSGCFTLDPAHVGHYAQSTDLRFLWHEGTNTAPWSIYKMDGDGRFSVVWAPNEPNVCLMLLSARQTASVYASDNDGNWVEDCGSTNLWVSNANASTGCSTFERNGRKCYLLDLAVIFDRLDKCNELIIVSRSSGLVFNKDGLSKKGTLLWLDKPPRLCFGVESFDALVRRLQGARASRGQP